MASADRSGELAVLRKLTEDVMQADGASTSDSDSAAVSIGAGTKDRAPRSTRASNVALHQLARRGMSRWELEQVLRRREVDPVVAAAELDRLEQRGLLDDAALAVTLVLTLQTRRHLGRAAIEHELRGRHIDAEIISDALAELSEDDDEERAVELARKRAGQLSGCDEPTARRRLSGYLARKGYDSATTRRAVDAALAGRSHGRVRFE